MRWRDPRSGRPRDFSFPQQEATGAAAAPQIGAILNAASYTLPGLPNYGIAPGSMFVVFGTELGPAALQQRSGQQFVFTSVDGRARMQIVNIGLSNASAVQITSGVQPGETVILPGSITLSDGESIVASGPPTTASAPPVARNGG